MLNPIRLLICKFVGHSTPAHIMFAYFDGREDVTDVPFKCLRCGKSLTLRKLAGE